MADVRPFRALRYATHRVPIAEVVTQPYDKITPEMRARYARRHPNNLVRILLPEAEGSASPYARAAETLRAWRAAGILEQAAAPTLFAYFQRYAVPGTGEVRTRKGCVGLVRLEDYASQVVFPHERTLSGPKQDRLELLRHTRTHFGQLFLLYSDTACRVDALLEGAASGEPELIVPDEYAVEHRVWPIRDPTRIAAICDAIRERRLIIADGHHRYETALAFRDEERSRPGLGEAGGAEWVMATLVNMESPGLTILPTHRVLGTWGGFDPDRLLERARAFFLVRRLASAGQLEPAVRGSRPERPVIGVGLPGAFAVLELREGLDPAELIPDVSPLQAGLDVVVLHRLVLERCLDLSEDDVSSGRYLEYVREADDALQKVASGAAQACFLLNPTRLEQVRDIAFGGEVLPQKSTDFFPKLLSGLTMYPIDEGAG